MNIKKISIRIGIILFLHLLGSHVYALSADCPTLICPSGVYFGFMLGPGQVTRTTSDNAGLILSPSTVRTNQLINISGSDVAFGGRIFVGFLYNRMFGAELGLGGMTSVEYDVQHVTVDLPGIPDVDPPVPEQFFNFNVRRDVTFGWIDLMARLQYPIGRITPFIKGGAAIVFLSISADDRRIRDLIDNFDNDNDNGTNVNVIINSNNVIINNVDDDDDDVEIDTNIRHLNEGFIKFAPAVSAGVSLKLSDEWSAEVAYTRIFLRTKIQAVDLVTIGFTYEFVDKYCGQFLCDS